MRKALLLFLLVSSVFFIACGNGGTVPEPEADTPAKCLAALKSAVDDRDAAAFLARLDSDNFEFNFDIADVGRTANNYTIPPSWSYAEENRGVTNLLTYAYSIDITLPTTDAEVGTPGEGETTYSKDNLTMDVEVGTSSGSGWRASGFFDVTFVKTGEKWLVRTWTDRTAPPPVQGIHEESYGYIKAIFYGWPTD